MRIAAALVLLLGCGPSSAYHGATSFSLEERESIESAAATMAARTGGEAYAITWDDGDDGDNRILRETPRAPDSAGEFRMGSGSYARTIYLDPSLTGNRLRVVTMHELGHSYGLDHHDQAGLMNRAEAVDVWTDADIEVCRNVGLCQ